ncbi:MAG: hypothetical protein JWM68_2694 [Verrucomicrobiales bacterium]|nr:hypothetical protein [Verrucomicrobiales bacterium]
MTPTRFRQLFSVAIILFATFSVVAATTNSVPLKQHSAFYTKEQLAKIRANVGKTPWATDMRNSIVSNAAPWMKSSDDELWDSVFGPNISRSWMVWSNGHCPACKKSVEMYNWKMDAWKDPWKTRCPHCQELFPKNDFQAFYRSGLDEHGVYDPKLANRALLFNTEHPDPADPLHKFGVDDGEGYVEGANRWRFIGTYLIFGQFHQRILNGIDTLSAAYVLTGDSRYAHKAGVLLDRIADVYPTFDFGTQGYVYEIKQASGYISVWHDTSEETYEMVIDYDQIFEGLREDKALLEFLSAKAEKFKLSNPKRTFADLQQNIEGRILRDALAHPEKIHSNFPRKECTEAMIHTVLAWPENKAAVNKMMDVFIAKATAVDGLTGEKGLAGYTAYTIAAMARFLNEYVRVDPTFLSEVIKRNPGLKQTYLFHIDTQCIGNYYPLIGDTLSFGQPQKLNPVMVFSTFGRNANLRAPLSPSMYSLYWQFYRETGNPGYVQTLYKQNNNSLKDLPYDIFESDPKGVQRAMSKVINKNGPEPKLASVNKQQWHLGILRSGKKENARALWVDYDSGGAHGHFDGMNLGLFAHGLDLLPDFGYPTVQFGGWGTPRALWYKMSAAHNTVVVDGQNHRDSAGQTTLWADGESFRAIRVSAPGLIGGKQFERTAALIDVSDKEFYVADIFRVVGGSAHAKLTHSYFGKASAEGVNFVDKQEYGNGTQTRNFQHDPDAKPGWNVTWHIEDPRKMGPQGKTVQMRYTDLTDRSQALLGESWVVGGLYNVSASEEHWIPTVISRRQGTNGFASTFVSVMEPFIGKSAITQTRRLTLQRNGEGQKSDVAIEITLTDGRKDLLISVAGDPAKPVPATQPDWNVELDGQVCWIRKTAKGKIERIALSHSRSVKIGNKSYDANAKSDFTELRP